MSAFYASIVGSVVKNPHANAGDPRDAGSIPVLGRSPREGNGNLLQYCRPGNSMDRGAWWSTVHGVTNTTEHPCNQAVYYRCV